MTFASGKTQVTISVVIAISESGLKDGLVHGINVVSSHEHTFSYRYSVSILQDATIVIGIVTKTFRWQSSILIKA